MATSHAMEKTTAYTKNAAAPNLTSAAFIKAKPLASRIGISARTLFRWADAGLIARHKINARVVLFDPTEVETFIRQCRVA